MVQRQQQLIRGDRALRAMSGLAVAAVIAAASFVPLTAEAAPSGCVSLTYQRGDSTVCVSFVQRILNGSKQLWGTRSWATLEADSVFGSRTDRSVRNYQFFKASKQHMPLAVDGVVGANTWRALCLDAHTIGLHSGSQADGYKAGLISGCDSIITGYQDLSPNQLR